MLEFMGDIFKVYPHNPPHYFVPNAMYMFTGAILHNQYLLSENRRKEFFLHTLLERTELIGWGLQAWAILNNHYHFVAQAPENATTLEKLIRQLHSITAIQINRWDNIPRRQVWFNYWDSCLTYERSYLARLHYVLMNPVKHGLVNDVITYPFCSYKWFIEQGDKTLREQVFAQPIDHVKIFDVFHLILWISPASWRKYGSKLPDSILNSSPRLHYLADFFFKIVRFGFQFFQLIQHLLPRRLVS